MTLIGFKIFAALTIFLAAFLAGLLPTAFSERHPRAISISEAIASGIFLGAALFHMIPDAETGFRNVGLHKFPYAITFCVISFFALAVIEQTTKYFSTQHTHKITSTLLLIFLSVHSLIAGAALGINGSITNAVVIYIAIIAHKSSASFALMVSLNKNFERKRTIILLLLLFSLMTPLGILLATELSTIIATEQSRLLEAVLNSLTAGTFLYIGTLDTLGRQLQPQRLINRFWEFSSLIFGMTMMGVIAAWV